MGTTADDLMAELNGELIDPLPAPAPERGKELEIKTSSPLSLVATANEQFATRAGGSGFCVKVKGDYISAEEGEKKKLIKPYAVEVNLPNLDAALSIIKNRLIKPALSRKYKDFVAVRTIYIVAATPLSPITPRSRNLAYMPFDDLAAYAREVRTPINPTEYTDVTHLREALIDWTQNPKGFEAREALRQKERAADQELLALNPDLL